MQRRLYYIFKSVAECKNVVNDLLLERIAINHMHVVAKPGTHLGDLPEASLSQTSDIRHSLFVGALLGAFMGIGAGIAFHSQLELPWGGFMILTTIVGILFGAWASSMVGMVAPNGHLKPYQKDIDSGKLLLIVDVPKEKMEKIETMLERTHPEAEFSGEDPTVPPFP